MPGSTSDAGLGGGGRAPNPASVFPPTRSGGTSWALGLRGSSAVRELLGAVEERGLGAPTPLHLPSPRGGRGSPFPPAVQGLSSALAMEGSAVNQTDPSWVWEWRGRVGGLGAQGPGAGPGRCWRLPAWRAVLSLHGPVTSGFSWFFSLLFCSSFQCFLSFFVGYAFWLRNGNK